MQLSAAKLWAIKFIFKEPLNMEQIHYSLDRLQEVSFIADNFIIHIFFSFNCQHLAIYDKDLEQSLWGIYNCFYLHTDYIYFYF